MTTMPLHRAKQLLGGYFSISFLLVRWVPGSVREVLDSRSRKSGLHAGYQFQQVESFSPCPGNPMCVGFVGPH